MRSVSVDYAELHAYSCFSFHRGASTVESLVEAARAAGLSGLAITDRDGLYGSVRQWLHTRRLRDGAPDEEKARVDSGSNMPLEPTAADLLGAAPREPTPSERRRSQDPGSWDVSAAPPRREALTMGHLDAHADRSVARQIEERSRLDRLRARRFGAGGRNPVPRAVYGAELRLAEGGRVVALVRDRSGWRNLSALISEARMSCEKGTALLPLERLVQRQQGLWILSGGRFGPVDRALLGLDERMPDKPMGPWGRVLGSWMQDSPLPEALARAAEERAAAAARRDDPDARFARAREHVATLRDAFGDRFVLELQDHRLPEDQWLRPLLTRLSEDLGVARVATNLVHYATPEDRRLADVLACVRLHTTLPDAGTALLPNGHFHLKTPRQMARLFADDLGAVALSAELAAECRFDLAELPYSFPVYPVPRGHTLQSYLEELTWEGAADRYGSRLDTDPRIAAQLRHELDVIGRMGLAGYFLIVWDLSNECRRRGILSQGRGSAANSCVCFCLKITAVDPIGLDLLFERFLSEARGGYPDIDIDVANSKREEVLQFVYDKYGRQHAAMVCNVITYHPRSAIRDVGKAFGLGLDQVDRMAKSLDAFSTADSMMDIFGEGGEEAITDDARTLRQVLHYTGRICGYPRHVGIHSGGVVISGTPLTEACPVENAAMEDRTVLQWDKDDVAHTGLVKIDLLALGMLSTIQEASRLLALRGVRFDMAELDCADPKVYDLICEADTVGLFQIESRAQMNTLPRLRPRCFHDLVIEVALIRPGPIQGKMVHPYLRRRAGREPITYAHPSLEPILKRTLGVPLFQEQAMKMAIATAGFSPGEADRLRKVMGFKRASEELESLFRKMVDGMMAGGIDEATAINIRDQLRGFAAYGFPESHSASFAVIVYASAYLKTYHPAAFFGGLLNCQPLGFYTPATLVGDARRRGVAVQPVCVNRSAWRWTLSDDHTLRTGLMQVAGLGEDDGVAVEEARRLGGPFVGVIDFCDRVSLPRNKLETLAEAGALACFGVDRRQALWQVAGWRPRLPLEGPARPAPDPEFSPMSPVELNLLDHGTTGVSPERHPLSFVREQLGSRGYLTTRELTRHLDGRRLKTAGLVITRQRPGTAKGVFFITLEDEFGFSNLVVHKELFEANRRLLRRVKFLGVSGRLQSRDGVVNVICEEFTDLSKLRLLDVGGRTSVDSWPSRDFH